MRSTLLLSTLALLANAAPHPRPQGIDLDVVQAAPQPTDVIDSSTTTGEIVTFDSESAISAIIASVISGDDEAVVDISNSTSDPIPDTNLERRAALRARTACATQIVGYGPVPSPDTPAVFSSYSAYASAALNAPTPSGYKSIYTNMNASNNAPAYLGYTTLKSYDTVLCSKKCDAIYGCASFNVYFERDPSVTPGTGCTNPPSTVNIKCVFWGGPISTTPKNAGQYQSQFQVLIQGSNGYTNNTIEPAPGYSGPTALGNVAINAPSDCNNQSTSVGVQIFTGGPFDANLCASACNAKSALAANNATTQPCRFFNTYVLLRNGVSVGQYCSMYSQTWASSYATYQGQTTGSDSYTVTYSYSFANSTDTYSPVCPADLTYLQTGSNGAAFCSSFISYSVPTMTIVATTVTATVTPATSTIVATITPFATSTLNTVQVVTATAQGQFEKRDDPEWIPGPFSIPVPFVTVNATASVNETAVTSTENVLQRRSLATPASMVSWPASKISSACSMIATGVSTVSVTSVTTATASTPVVTITSTAQTSVATVTSLATTTTTVKIIPTTSPVTTSVPSTTSSSVMSSSIIPSSTTASTSPSSATSNPVGPSSTTSSSATSSSTTVSSTTSSSATFASATSSSTTSSLISSSASSSVTSSLTTSSPTTSSSTTSSSTSSSSTLSATSSSTVLPSSTRSSASSSSTSIPSTVASSATSTSSATTPAISSTITSSSIKSSSTLATTSSTFSTSTTSTSSSATTSATVCPAVIATGTPTSSAFYMKAAGLPWGNSVQYVTLRWNNLWISSSQNCSSTFSINSANNYLTTYNTIAGSAHYGELLYATQGSADDVLMYWYSLAIPNIQSGNYYSEPFAMASNGAITATRGIENLINTIFGALLGWLIPPASMVFQVCPDTTGTWQSQGNYGGWAPYIQADTAINSGCKKVTISYAGRPSS